MSEETSVQHSDTIKEENTTDNFIDDYSHLRLSYYRKQKEDSFDLNEVTDISFELSNEINDTTVKDEQQSLKDYYISQIPDLPHPSFTVASIIASASQKMGSVNLKYNDRIEQGNVSKNTDMEFVPQRRSTLKPKKLDGN
ncbi:uncharacterized protein LOC114249305 [Bombyx mandarina]|uniref:Uncharacterized protein n=2 Tax=Bombyx TaxID=7090 RepID=A0A8R2MAC3_BOMMO|nr:uncharacterized protein LOC114249305 [Bombyx mandarina]XP_037876409.1 uncharacterized protein LOC101737526 [Bombyx mori]